MPTPKLSVLALVAATLVGSISAQTPLSEAKGSAFERLASRARGILSHSNVSPAQITALRSSAVAALAEARRPDPQEVRTLIGTVRGARQDGRIATIEKSEIETDLFAVLKSANVTGSKAIALRNALVPIAGEIHVTRSEARELFRDLRALARTLPAGSHDR